jgi:hypothetical protein
MEASGPPLSEGTPVYRFGKRKLRMTVNNENEEGTAQPAAGDCPIYER